MAFRNTNILTSLDILGVELDVTPTELKKKYKELCLEYHPDKYTDEKGKKNCEEYFKAIQHAFEKVSAYINLTKATTSKKREHECCEKDEPPTKRQRTEDVKPTGLQDTGLFNEKRIRVKRYFSDEWHFEANYNHFMITSHELRLLKLSIFADRDDKLIWIKLPPIVRENTQTSIQDALIKHFEAEITSLSSISLDIKNNTTFYISNDNLDFFIKMLEFIIETYQLGPMFGHSTRALINHKWYEGNLYADRTPPSTAMTPQ